MASNTRVEFAEIYFKVKARLTRQLDALKARHTALNSTTIPRLNDTVNQTCSRRSRLPEMQLATFNGKYEDWPEFYAMFNTVVGSNEDLSKIEKLQHLRSCLEGAAIDTIKSLEPSEANYDKAIELLIRRFDNKLLQFQGHIRSIFGLPGVEKGSAQSLRALSDNVNSHLRALGTIATSEQIADGLLINIISRKLDANTQEKWEEALESEKIPKWSNMASFIERRC